MQDTRYHSVTCEIVNTSALLRTELILLSICAIIHSGAPQQRVGTWKNIC
jgi:hypothetical protein